jgi:ketosteroid isomerase-like protein
MPKGRNEKEPYHSLGDWVRPRNMCSKGGTGRRYHALSCACAAHSELGLGITFYPVSGDAFSFNPKQRRNSIATAALKSQTSRDEADIRALIETINQAHRKKDVAGIAAASAQDAVVCDLAPPLSHPGMDLQVKQAWLVTWEGLERESRDFHVVVSGDCAFCHGYFRLAGTPKAADQFLDARNYVPASRWRRLAVHDHECVAFCINGSLRPAFDLKLEGPGY